MLSRIAESLFWIGRYLERADDTARILDVELQVLVEDPTIDEEHSCRQLLTVMGVEEYPSVVNRWTILDLLAHNPESPSSIAYVIDAARENARGARETLSTDMWAAINTMWRGLPSARAMRSADMFGWVRNRTAMIAGIADSTMTRDEGWQFFMLGRSIERVDMTARLLSTASLAAEAQLAWPTTLRACGAYEAFIRAYRGLEADRLAAEFLLLDRWFPRSVVSALVEAEKALATLEAGGQRTGGQRSGFSDEGLRLLGRARTELEYRPLAEIVYDLPTEMERLQRSCAAASEAVTTRYFSLAESRQWSEGALL
ncbi:alpha-E domain-containing protein [Aeromicrobium sp. Leaf350]|uniref:alpha-E domain-containing protein n=1 Tax=Aeromicrobium sp. Leaf350 TaxID=2876565 RepID=UPI001E2EEAA0|nr:alpha-E domain-containing protein [Aeromicrobium sp. Leaf350]